MKTSLSFFVMFLYLGRTDAYEAYRLPSKPVMRLEYYGVSLLRPYVSSYGGPVRHKVVINCKTKTKAYQPRPHIQWYRHVPDNYTCQSENSTLITTEGKFCTETRTRFFMRRRRKYTSKLVLRRPRVSDSGIYMCVVSSRYANITLNTKLSFHRTEDPPIRLMDSFYGNYGEGRVQLFLNNNWREVNIFTWESPEASLICRLLGFRFGGEPTYPRDGYDSFYFSYDKKNLVSPDCPLNSTSLSDCRFGETQTGFSGGATCRRTPNQAPTRRMRFAGGSPSEGRVEVYSQGFWGTVCKKGITWKERSMICRAMGYNYGGVSHKAWPSGYRANTLGVGPIMLSGLRCPRNAQRLEQCSWNTLGTACCNCTHNDDLAIRCRVRPDEDDPSFRVRLAAYGSDKKGRVEVYHEGGWRTADANWLREAEANMFCKMLGFQYGGEPMIATSGFELMMMSYIRCPLDASTIENCTVSWRGKGIGLEAGGVICRQEPIEVPEITFRIGRNNEGVEKLQYFKDGYWGTVCGTYLGTPEASMVCSMMGHRYGGLFVTSYKKWSHKGLGPVLLEYLDCPMNATSLEQCPYRNYTKHDYRACGHSKDVNIRCHDKPQNTSIPVRLNGTEPNRGILQIYREDSWRFVSFASNPEIASVVCRQLGFSNGGEMYPSYECTNCDFDGHLYGYSECTGKESNIGQCNNLRWDNVWWIFNDPMAIHCYLENENPFEVSLTETTKNGTEGTVTVTKDGERYFVCAKLWDEIHARAYCRSAGYSDGTPTYYKKRQHYACTDKSILAMYCQRGVNDLRQCYHTGLKYQCENDCFTTGPLRAGVSCIP